MSDIEKEFSNSPLRESTLQLHEIFLELRAAGFSKRQSLYLVSKILTSVVGAGADDIDN
jgi:hypothetical protein